jgi:ABC-type polar amino acid transport system ATPase subunit
MSAVVTVSGGAIRQTEPRSGLQTALRGQRAELVMRLTRFTVLDELDATQQAHAANVADHMYFTDGGVVVEHGPPAEFFSKPRHERTRAFLSRIL